MADARGGVETLGQATGLCGLPLLDRVQQLDEYSVQLEREIPIVEGAVVGERVVGGTDCIALPQWGVFAIGAAIEGIALVASNVHELSTSVSVTSSSPIRRAVSVNSPDRR